jgi:uncharacterized RDD family membrane protein YckC
VSPEGWTGPEARAGRVEVRTLDGMDRDASPPSQQRVRGASLGLPPAGPGSLASFSTRVVAYLADAVIAAVLAALFTVPNPPGYWSLLSFGIVYVLSLVAFGQTPGMRLLGLRLAHPREGERLAPWRAVVRTALLMLLVPALVVDADGRGLHDRLTDTAVVRDN